MYYCLLDFALEVYKELTRELKDHCVWEDTYTNTTLHIEFKSTAWQSTYLSDMVKYQNW